MDTNLNTPQAIFYLPQRLIVPLFQRRYVWDEEKQWRPLWQDVERISEKVLKGDHGAKHFLGAIVLQQESTNVGTLNVRSVIDGQQRLTTLQLLFDAIHNEIDKLGFENIARRLDDLVSNSQHQRTVAEDEYKIWPTKWDRAAFSEVMSANPLDYSQLENKKSRIVSAHKFFAEQTHAWLTQSTEGVIERAQALVEAVATRLQIVTIELKSDEDAQEIFETLNARGTPLTPAELIKNLVFQRLNEAPETAEVVYHAYWEKFENTFWEKEVSSGRILSSRSSLFLTQWLTSRTQRDIPSREVFTEFKKYLDDEVNSVETLLMNIRASADIYQGLLEKAEDKYSPMSNLEMFVYRTGELQSEITKPLLIWLTDPSLPPLTEEELNKGLAAVESWLVRRTLVREKSAGQNRFMVDLLAAVAVEPRDRAGTTIENLLRDQTADTSYWPDDEMVRAALSEMPIYKKISRGRLRMILEAVEDRRRGFPKANAKGEGPVLRRDCSIEHVMPQRWGQHWSLPEDMTDGDRDTFVHTIGNLTLVSKALNSSLSNAAWNGKRSKKVALSEFSTIKITADVIRRADENDNSWDEEVISLRTMDLIEDILKIWPVPTGHTNSTRLTAKGVGLSLKDLMRLGLVHAGDVLMSSHTAYDGASATVQENGHLLVGDKSYESPTGAAKASSGKRTINGWWYWRVNAVDGPRLSELKATLEEPDEVDFGPFTVDDMSLWWEKDTSSLEDFVLTFTSELSYTGDVFPAQNNKGEFRVGRYWCQATDEPNIFVGVPKDRPPFPSDSPIWARFSQSTSKFTQAMLNLTRSSLDVFVDTDTGSLWIPLIISPDLHDRELLDDVKQQVLAIDSVARSPLSS